MKLSDFFFELPEHLIAKHPLPNRTDSRLLCLNRKTHEIEHRQFKNIIDLLQPNDLLVFNDTKVIPARLYGKKSTGGKFELLIEKIISSYTAQVMLRSNKSPKIHAVLEFANDIQATVLDRQDRFYLLEFNQPIMTVLNQQGEIPLPHYMHRDAEYTDKERYQTVYAKHEGAVAAPTAGLHFDKALLESIKNKHIQSAFVTLHVGAGTFLPVQVDNIQEHRMHSEYIEVSQAVCEVVAKTKRQGGRVIAVGTTTVRSLETAAKSGTLLPFAGETTIFIYPGYHFNCVDAIVTNFHLPESTLIMLVSAFAGRELIMKSYAEAIKNAYRFFSYGDAMFIR